MLKLSRNSVSLTVQHLDIGTISQQEYSHRDSGKLLEDQGHFDSKTNHLLQNEKFLTIAGLELTTPESQV